MPIMLRTEVSEMTGNAKRHKLRLSYIRSHSWVFAWVSEVSFSGF
jgi:hypothetical protein